MSEFDLPTPGPTPGEADAADRAMAEFCRSGEPAALGRLFDLAAPALRRVAQHLAGDASTADDLVQVTFLVALERAATFRPGAKVQPWLTGILRNQALLVHRRRRRQVDHERLAPEPDNDPASVAERAEIGARIEAAIGELSEAYRPVLVLALQHGLGAHEIAAALGRPEGSVRTQLMRGLEKLRALLPVSLAGVMAGLLPSPGWAAVRATVLAAAARQGVVLAAAAAPAVLLSGIAMTKKLMVAAAVALVASAAWFVFSDSPPPVIPGGDPTSAAMTAKVEAPAAEVASSAPQRQAAAASAPGVLRGRLLHAQTRAPLAGVEVEARDARRKLAEVTMSGGPARATTDADGRFVMEFKALAQVQRFVIARSAHNVGAELRRSLRIELGASVDVELEASAGVRVSGVVVGPEGKPQPHARVFAWDGGDDGVLRLATGFDRQPDVQGVADAQGRFDLEAVGEEFTLSADHGTLWCLERAHGVRQARAHIEGVELRLAPTVDLVGRLLDHDGAPVPDHDVRSARGSSQRGSKVPEVQLVSPEYVDARTDAQGRFRVRALAEHVYQLDVEHPQRPNLRVAHRPADGEVTLRFARGDDLAGHVFLADGSPAAGAVVTWSSVFVRKAVCDPTGSFRVVGLQFREGSTLRIDHDAAAIFVQSMETAPQGDLRVQLEPPLRIAGRVVDARGQPVVGTEVRVVGDRVLQLGFITDQPTTAEYVAGANRATTATDGSFVFARLYPGEFAVRAQDTASLDAYVEVSVRSGSEGVVLRLPDLERERVTLRGRVRVPRGDVPARVSVLLWRKDTTSADPASMSAKTHDVELRDGSFELRGVQPGEIRIEVRCVGFATWIQPMRDFPAGGHDVDVEFLPVRNITVEVRDPSGAPVSGGITAKTHTGETLWFSQGSTRSNSAHVDNQGRAQLHGLPERLIVLSVTVPGHDVPFQRDVDLRTLRDDVVRVEVGAAPEMASLLPVLLVALPDAKLESLSGIRDQATLVRQVFAKPVTRPLDVDCELRLVDAAGKVVSRAKVETRKDNPSEPAYRAASSWVNGGSEQTEFIPTDWPLVDLHAYPGAFQLEIAAKGYEPVRMAIAANDFQAEAREGQTVPMNPKVVPVFLRKVR